MTADTTASPSGAEPRAFVLLKSRRRLDLLNPNPHAWRLQGTLGEAQASDAYGRPSFRLSANPFARGFLTRRTAPDRLPAWLTEQDIDFYAGEFTRTGFRGGLNWYRNMDRDCGLMGTFAGLRLTVPALYITGDRDMAVAFVGRDRLDKMAKHVSQMRDAIMLPGCGDWTQQERPAEVNAALIGFLRGR